MIIRILGLLLLFNGTFMSLTTIVSFIYEERSWIGIATAGGVTIAIGGLFWLFSRGADKNELKLRDGYIIVTLGWLAMSFSGALPYVITGAIPSFTDAFFETISGYTTTGASILNNIETLPYGILFWRSLTQWIGGMGIIVLAVAILPLLGIGGMQLFVAEAPGITPDKLKPRIADTAKRLWFIYIALTGLEAIFLLFGGMNLFDAINHSLTTMATGGFSTKQDSIAYYNSAYIEYVITGFMFLAGTSFTLTYFGLKGNFKRVWSNEEFRFYFALILLFTIITSVVIYMVSDRGAEGAFRDAIFQVVSIITTTGYVSADYTSWAPVITTLFFMIMFIGGSAGSTAGGAKVVRLLILMKNTVLEIKRQLHPSAIIPVRYNNKAVTMDITFNTLAFIMLYITIFIIGTLVMAALGLDFETALGAVATSLSNIGPGIGSVGPLDNFSQIPAVGKWLLGFLMLLGRLELFTVLILFTGYFWKKY